MNGTNRSGAYMIRRRISFVFVCLFLSATVPANAVEFATLLRCQWKASVSLGQDGLLHPDALSDQWRSYYGSGFIVDILTGVVRSQGGDDQSAELWTVTRVGNSANDTVLVLHPGDATSASTDFLRIRQWAQEPVALFLLFGLSTIKTGTCTPVQ